MIEIKAFKEKLKNQSERFPVLTLEDFFVNNTNEGAIAPNQWGFGRPHLMEMYDIFKKLESMDDVAWVRVEVHDDTEIYCQDGKEVLFLSGDSIVLCTTIQPEEIESLVNCKWLCSDGVVTVDSSFVSRTTTAMALSHHTSFPTTKMANSTPLQFP